jgi:hypothetical protein
MLAIAVLSEKVEHKALTRAKPASESWAAKIAEIVVLAGITLDAAINLETRFSIRTFNFQNLHNPPSTFLVHHSAYLVQDSVPFECKVTRPRHLGTKL